jgi:hypothetical protein
MLLRGLATFVFKNFKFKLRKTSCLCHGTNFQSHCPTQMFSPTVLHKTEVLKNPEAAVFRIHG